MSDVTTQWVGPGWTVEVAGQPAGIVMHLDGVGFVGVSPGGTLIAGPCPTRRAVLDELVARAARPAAVRGQLVVARHAANRPVAHIVAGGDPGGARTLCSVRLSAPLLDAHPSTPVCARCTAASRAAARLIDSGM